MAPFNRCSAAPCNSAVYTIQFKQVENTGKFSVGDVQKLSCEFVLRMRAGSEFHAAGPAIVNELSARHVLVRRTTKSPRVDDRRR